MEYFANQDQRFNSFYFDLTLEKRAPGTCFSRQNLKMKHGFLAIKLVHFVFLTDSLIFNLQINWNLNN